MQTPWPQSPPISPPRWQSPAGNGSAQLVPPGGQSLWPSLHGDQHRAHRGLHKAEVLPFPSVKDCSHHVPGGSGSPVLGRGQWDLLLWTAGLNSLFCFTPVLKKSCCWAGALWPRAAVPPWFLQQPFCISHSAPGCGALPPATNTWTEQAGSSCHSTPRQVSPTTATTVFPGSVVVLEPLS